MGSIDGRGSDGDVVNLSAYSSATNVALLDADNADGFDGTATNGGTIVAFDNISTIRGAGPSNTLTGPDFDNAWTLTAAGDTVDDGTIVTSGRTLNFFDFPNLTGQSGVDGFALSGGTLSGIADGGGANTFTADNVAINTWALGVSGTGDVDGVGSFSNIGNAIGGNAVTDNFNANALFDGTIDGQGGADHLILNVALGDTDTVLTASSANGFDGSSDTNPGGLRIVDFADIDQITSGGNTDTLTGDNASNTWTINAGNSGTVLTGGNPFAWNDFDVVNGGTLAGIFNIDNSFSPGTIDGGNGNDTFNLAIGVAVGILRGGGNGGAGDTIVGPDDINAWDVSASDGGTIDGQAYSQIENLKGGTANDTFTIADGIVVAGTIDGGAGAGVDTVDFANFNLNPVSVLIATLNDIEVLSGSITRNDSEIVGANGSNIWTLTGNGVGNINGIAYTLFQNLTGGTADDTFNVNANHTGNLAGGADDDIFNFAASTTLSGTVTGDAGADLFDFADLASVDGGATVAVDGGADFDTIDFFDWAALQAVSDAGNSGSGSRGTIGGGGGPGVDVLDVDIGVADEYFDIDSVIGNGGGLAGPNQDNVWVVNGIDTGTLNGTGFTNFFLQGNAARDDFSLDPGGSLTGGIDGGTGDNTFTTSNADAATINILGAQNGTHSDAFWSFAFSNIDDVSGGDASDIITVSADFTGTIAGGGGTDTFNLNSAVGTVDGGGGADTFNITNGQLIGTLTGGAGVDIIVGGNVANEWHVTADNAGTLNPLTGNDQAFSGIESWTGNTLVDSFEFQGDFIVDGTLDGAGGNDALDLSLYLAQTDATLTVVGGTDGFAETVETDGATTVANFDNMNSILGSATLPDQSELTGSNTVNDWQITGSGTVSTNAGVNLIAFDNFELLTGGGLVDTFTLASVFLAGAAPANLDGGGGLDVLIGTAGTNVWDITGADSGTVTNDAGVHVHLFSSIENLTGNAAVDDFLVSIGGSLTGTIAAGGNADILTGRDSATSWTINADGGGSSSHIGAFVNVETLEGGSAIDTFNLTASGRINAIDGGGSFDVLVGDNEINTWTILAAGDAGSVTNVNDGITNFTSVESLTGNADMDDFTFANGGFLSGALDGAGGIDDIDFSLQTGAVDVVVGSVGGGIGIVALGIVNTESVTGNGAQSTLFGEDIANTWDVNVAANQGDVNGTLSFENFHNLVGGDVGDTFNVGFAVDGSIDGGAGGDTFNLAAGTPFVRGGTGADSLDVTGDFSHAGVVDISAVETIESTTGKRITTTGAGNGIRINGASTRIGLVGSPILSAIGNLEITGSSGTSAFFSELNNIVLQGIDLGGANIFNLIAGGTVSDGAGTTVDAATLTVSALGNIGSFSDRINTTATTLNITANGGSNAFVVSSSALTTDTIALTAAGGPQTVVVGGDSLIFNTNNIDSFSSGFLSGDTIGFTTTNDIDVNFNTISMGSGRNVQLVAGDEINLAGGATIFNLTIGSGRLGLGGIVRAGLAGDSFSVNGDGIDILGDTTLAFDTLNLNVPFGAVDSNGESSLTIVPFTQGANMDIGNGTPFTGQNSNSVSGFNGPLNLGGVTEPRGGGGLILPGIAGDVVVTRPITLGPLGVLTIAALGDLVIEQPLDANQINLIAIGDDGTALGAAGTIGACGGCILDVGSTDVILADSVVLVANNTIGLEENNLNVDIQSTLDFASGQEDISATLSDQFVTFSGTNLGAESSAIVTAYQLAFSNIGFSIFQTDLSAIFTPPGLGTGLEVRDESLFSTDASAYETDFLIFDPGEGVKTPFDQDPELPSQDDFPFDLDNDQAWEEFYRGDVLEFVKARWLGDETLATYVNENYQLDLGPEGGTTFEDIIALRDLLADKAEPTPQDEELLRILEAFVGEYPKVADHFVGERTRLKQEAFAAKDLQPLDLPGDGTLDDGLNLPDDGVDPGEEGLDPTEDGLDLPTGEDGLPVLESSIEPDSLLYRFAGLRVIGQGWGEGGLGIEDSWTGRLPSVFPIEMPARAHRGES